ncbi:MAG TPA: zinc-dependent metalloprotease [Streptosporangiaceae bacterium]|nr:zinc-dependent metalloprotease [Streptosporangiaceae bacterium]
MIDWNVATSTAIRWVRPGPQVSLSDARNVVAELRAQAALVADPVREVTGLPGDDDGGKVAIVDRPGWIKANISGFEVVLDPLVEHMQEIGAVPAAGSVLTAVGSRVTGVQAGLILAYLASRVLGQYELFLPPDPDVPAMDAPPGRLTLVAPNILMVERELGVDPSDFRRWVCLHEETHRTQFTSVSWLRPYVQQQMTEFLLASDLDPASILNRLRAAADAVSGAVRGGDGESLIEAMQSQRQREILGRLTSVMTLVEGHGDYVMDAVGPTVVPSVEQIRAKFNARRSSGNRIEQAIRRILGIDLKMRQYQQGSAFVRAVVEAAGMATFNLVWTSPQTLPSKEELTDPAKWLERVAGGNQGRELNPGVA